MMALFPPPAVRDADFTNAPDMVDAALEAAATPSNTPALSTCLDASPTLPREDAVRLPLLASPSPLHSVTIMRVPSVFSPLRAALG